MITDVLRTLNISYEYRTLPALPPDPTYRALLILCILVLAFLFAVFVRMVVFWAMCDRYKVGKDEEKEDEDLLHVRRSLKVSGALAIAAALLVLAAFLSPDHACVAQLSAEDMPKLIDQGVNIRHDIRLPDGYYIVSKRGW